MGVVELLLILVFCVGLIILGSSVLKVHPFLVLVFTSIVAGFLLGLPLSAIVKTVTSGFGSILGYIGLVIVLGGILGEVLGNSGAAERIALYILQGAGKKNPRLAISFLGAFVGIPVFCDTGFIILSKLTKAISVQKGISSKALSISLAAGLYTTHTLIPPTPGPIAAAGNLGGSDYLGLIMLVGLCLAVPAILVGYLLSSRISFNEPESNENTGSSPDGLPSITKSVLPIVLPIVLIASGTTLKLASAQFVGVEYLLLLGDPVIALLISLAIAFFLLRKSMLEDFGESVKSGVMSAGPVLIITGAGGAFGAVLKASSLAENLEVIFKSYALEGVGLLLIAFLLAALLKTSQGSSTSAIVITSSLLSPFLTASGIDTPMEIALLVMAIGGGAMTFSHANDSYFWVVSQFGELTVKEAHRSYSIITLAQGVTTLVLALLLSLIFV